MTRRGDAGARPQLAQARSCGSRAGRPPRPGAGRPAPPPGPGRWWPEGPPGPRAGRGGPPSRLSDPAGATARAVIRSGELRRRATPRAGNGSRTRPPARVRSGDGRRRTSRSPAAAAMGRSRRRIADPSPPARSIASRPPRPTTPPTRAVPRWRATRDRSAGSPRRPPAGGARSAMTGRIATSNRSVATTAGSSVRTVPRSRPVIPSPATFRATRPGPARSTVRPWTWTSRTRTVRPSPSGTTRRIAPRSIGAPRSVPVTTVPRPRIANTRSMARRLAGSGSSALRATPARTRSRSASSPARSSSRPAPVVAETARTSAPASCVDAIRARASARTAATRSGATASVFVTTTRPSASPSASISSRCSTV